MELSKEQIKNLVETRPHKREIQKGVSHQQRLRFHTQTTLSKWDFSSAYNDFKHWIATESPSLLPADKTTRILQLIRAPISTVELTESIFSKLRKIFHAQDSFFDYSFTNPELLIDWQVFREQSFWATHGFQAMQSAIDSVWVVDFPEMQKGSRPEPINRLIDIKYVIDIQNDIDNNCQWLVYESSMWNGSKNVPVVIVYDAHSIRIYDDTINVELFEFVHGLGYTPARMFWSESLEDDNLVNKESPITKELSDLDWYLLHKSMKKYMDLANSYPREFMYEFDDDSEDPTRTNDKDSKVKTPIGHELMGPGSVGVVKAPLDAGEADQMKNPFLLVSPKVDGLEWHVTEEKRLKNDIFRSVVGIDIEMKNEAAKNEKQVDSAFESQLAVLLRVKKNFEIINKFADSTICKLRYGDSFVNCTIDYGTGFFLKSLSELHEDYNLAKKAGNNIVLSEITSNILDAKFRENQQGRQRAEIIQDLDPMPEKTDEEVIEIYKNKGIDKINFVIRMNLNNFVRRFEREQINLTQFGENLEYGSKIESIINIFKNYANERNEDDSGKQGTIVPDQGD